MYSIKDKVSEKLSRLFSDSSNKSAAAASPSLDDTGSSQSKARSSYSQDGKAISSSYLSYISLDRFRSKKCEPDVSPYPYQSLSVGYGGENCVKDESGCDSSAFRTPTSCEAFKGDISVYENGKSITTNEVNGSQRSTCNSCLFEEPIEQQYSPKNHHPKLADDSVFLSPDLYEFLHASLPNLVKDCQWVLLYSTVKHGISLRTLIRNSNELSGPCLLIVGDMQGAVFGALLEGPLKPTPKRKYQGTNQTFVFTTIHGAPRLFRPTGANRYYYMCLNDLVALGGGGNFALSLDSDLLSGTSGPCETFGNMCLAHTHDFELKNVELWGFSHSSRYRHHA